MRSKIRAPFVVTVAVVTSGAIACSGADKSDPSYPPGYFDSDVADSQFDLGSLETETTGDARAVDTDPNPSQCPPDDPGFGARKTCDAALTVKCAYPDLCPSKPKSTDTNVYVCHDDGTGKHWTLASDPYTPACPTDQPKDGDPCPCTIHMGFAACNYGMCEAMTRIYAACKGVDTFDPVWHVSTITCNPPEPDGGRDGASDADAETD